MDTSGSKQTQWSCCNFTSDAVDRESGIRHAQCAYSCVQQPIPWAVAAQGNLKKGVINQPLIRLLAGISLGSQVSFPGLLDFLRSWSLFLAGWRREM